MRLPFFNNNNKDKSEYYLALLLMDEKAGAVVLEAADGKIKILSKHEELFPDSIENVNLDNLINTVDKAISRAEEILPPNIETHKTVFGVKKNWIEKETKKIKKEYLGELKKLCAALDLSPIGFMVTQEAVTHLLQEEEGVPLSAILAEIGKNQVDVTLLRGGKVVEEVSGPLNEPAPNAVDTLLKHFTVPVLPARIILFHSEKDEKLTQQFITHAWSKSLPFLHVPQITVLPEGFGGQAVTFGAATQMGLEMLDFDKKPIQTIEPTDKTTHEKPEQAALEEDPQPASINAAPDFGFILDQDIATVKPHKHEEAEKSYLPHETHARHHEAKAAIHHEEKHHVHHAVSDNLQELPEQEDPSDRVKIKKHTSFNLISLLTPLKFLTPRISSPRLPFRLIVPLALLVILVGGVAYFYFFKVNAKVVLSVKPKIVEENAKVTFSTTASSDFSKNILAAKTVSTTVEGDASIATTGKKEMGEKAKGKVTLYNISDSEQELSEGTTIKSSNGLLFTLDKNVKIASGSSDPINPKSGTTQAAVTAKDIGTESNLPSGTKFTIGGNTTLAAKNDSAFSGGSKKSITVVSKDDQSKLRNELLKKLEEKAREALSKKAESGTTLLPQYTNSGFSKTKFDKSVGDETKTLKLTGAVSFNGIAYKDSELTDYAKSLIKNKYAQDINFAENSIKETIKEAKEKSDKEAEASVIIQAGLLPKIDVKEAIKKINNKSPKQAEEVLAGLPQVEKSSLTFSPNIPFLPNIFSRLPRNINVVVESE